jgi:hypothetical protein
MKEGEMMIFPELAKLMAIKQLSHKAVGAIIDCKQQAATKKLNGETEFKRSEMNKLKSYFQKEFPALNITLENLFKEDIFLPS